MDRYTEPGGGISPATCPGRLVLAGRAATTGTMAANHFILKMSSRVLREAKCGLEVDGNERAVEGRLVRIDLGGV